MDLSSLVVRYRRKGVLVDANLLIGYLIGNFDFRQLANCRATKNFGWQEFVALDAFLDRFERIVTTPHVLTEVSNLAGRLPASMHGPFRKYLAEFIADLDEQTVAAKELCRENDFIKFGLANTAIAFLAPGRFLVLTDELPLTGSLIKRGVDVVNFNTIRYSDSSITE